MSSKNAKFLPKIDSVNYWEGSKVHIFYEGHKPLPRKLKN